MFLWDSTSLDNFPVGQKAIIENELVNKKTFISSESSPPTQNLLSKVFHGLGKVISLPPLVTLI